MKYRELIDKFNNIQRQCASLAWEYARELNDGEYDEEQREWIEDVKLKLEELAEY